MIWIGKQAAFYRGYLPHDRSLVPLTVLLSTTLALWLLVYLVVAVAEAHQDAGVGRVASVTFPRPSACEFADPARYLRPHFPALLCNRGQLRSRHAELTPQKDKRLRRGRGWQIDSGLDPLMALPASGEFQVWQATRQSS
jgi:hypothetical protein